MPDDLLSLKEAAARLRVSVGTMAEYIRRRIIPAYAMNGKQRGRVDDVCDCLCHSWIVEE